jgi:hypothetical protein
MIRDLKVRTTASASVQRPHNRLDELLPWAGGRQASLTGKPKTKVISTA